MILSFISCFTTFYRLDPQFTFKLNMLVCLVCVIAYSYIYMHATDTNSVNVNTVTCHPEHLL